MVVTQIRASLMQSNLLEDLIAGVAFIHFDGYSMRLKGFAKESDEDLHSTHYPGTFCVQLESDFSLQMASELSSRPEYLNALVENPSALIVTGSVLEGFIYNGPFDSQEAAVLAKAKFPYLSGGCVLWK
jgi:hypothetical protein